MNFRKMIVAGVIASLTATAFATPVVLNLVTDDFPAETWFEMLDGSNTAIAFDSYTGPSAASLDDGLAAPGDITEGATAYSFTWDLSAGDYEFMIFDTFGDGICCGFGMGSYELVVDGTVVGSGGDFGSGMLETFTVEATNVPEAGMLALFGIGLIGLGVARRKA